MLASFDRFCLTLTKDQARAGSHSGRCDDDVADLLTDPRVARQLRKIDPGDIRAELRAYGAWDDRDLASDSENRLRILWIACGDVVENLPR